jgi:hypothetical protein
MKKTILFFTFFLASLVVHAQTDYGILIKSTMKPKNPNASSTRYTVCGVTDYYITGSTGSIDIYNKRFCTNNIIPNLNGNEKIQYDFFYTKDIDGIFILDVELNGQNQAICAKEYAIPYNKNTFTEVVLGGCAGRSNVLPIHLTQPSINTICNDETINLSNGWDWQYQFDADGWKPFPAQFQGTRSVSFKLKDLDGYDGKSQVFIQAGYQTKFTNTISYSIIPCSPLLDGNPIPTAVKCNNEASGSVTLKFKSEIKTNDKFLFNIFFNTSPPQFIKHAFATKGEIINNTFTWNNIGQGNYIIKYQTQSDGDNTSRIGSNAIDTPSFIIKDIPPLTFTAKDIQPKCYTDKGSILVTAKGGTPPYYYILDSETKKELTTNPYTIPILTDGDHKVIIVDSNNCIEK